MAKQVSTVSAPVGFLVVVGEGQADGEEATVEIWVDLEVLYHRLDLLPE